MDNKSQYLEPIPAIALDEIFANQQALPVFFTQIIGGKKQAAEAAWPVGSIFITVNTTEPADLFGFGTWVTFGAGRVLVSQDTTQTEFDVIAETGGDKNTEAHKHWISGAAWDDNNFSGHGGNTQEWGLYSDSGAYSADDPDHSYGRYSKTFGTGTAGNLQPYIVVYMWKRTA